MPRVVWSRSIESRSRDPLLGAHLAYLPERGISGVDREGVVRWTRPTAVGHLLPTDPVFLKLTGVGNDGSLRGEEVRPTLPPAVGLAALPENRLLAWDGGPVVLDEHGSEVNRWRGGPVEHVEWMAGTILLVGNETAHIAGPDLRVRREFPRPTSLPAPSCGPAEFAVNGESLYWTHGNWLMAWTPEREVQPLVEIPASDMVQACADYEERMGRAASPFGHRFILHEGRVHRVDAEDPARLGSELRPDWKLTLDRRARLAFLTTMLPPSFVACVSLDGTFRWVEVMGHLCCGGRPRALPDGGYVVSQNCGMRIVWFDREGQVRHQRNHESAGDNVGVLSGGVTLVADDGGVFAYGPESEPLWLLERPNPSLVVNEEGTAFLMVHADDSGVIVELATPS